MNNTELIESIPSGKTFSKRTEDFFYHVRRIATGYQVECGWVVPEAHDDDYDSVSYHPFQSQRPRPWVGRQFDCLTATDAAEVFGRVKTAMLARQPVVDGKIIGSVVR